MHPITCLNENCLCLLIKQTHAWLPKFDALHSVSSNAMQGLV